MRRLALLVVLVAASCRANNTARTTPTSPRSKSAADAGTVEAPLTVDLSISDGRGVRLIADRLTLPLLSVDFQTYSCLGDYRDYRDGDRRDPFVIACDPRVGPAYVRFGQGELSIEQDGRRVTTLAIRATRVVIANGGEWLSHPEPCSTSSRDLPFNLRITRSVRDDRDVWALVTPRGNIELETLERKKLPAGSKCSTDVASQVQASFGCVDFDGGGSLTLRLHGRLVRIYRSESNVDGPNYTEPAGALSLPCGFSYRFGL